MIVFKCTSTMRNCILLQFLNPIEPYFRELVLVLCKYGIFRFELSSPLSLTCYIQTGKLCKKILKHNGRIVTLCVSQDSTVFSGGFDKIVYQWDISKLLDPGITNVLKYYPKVAIDQLLQAKNCILRYFDMYIARPVSAVVALKNHIFVASEELYLREFHVTVVLPNCLNSLLFRDSFQTKLSENFIIDQALKQSLFRTVVYSLPL